MTTKLYAFWKHDTFPYVLGAPVDRINRYGNIEAEGYAGMSFSPIKLLPREDGEKLQKDLDDFQAEYRKALAGLNDNFNHRLNSLSTNAGIGAVAPIKEK